MDPATGAALALGALWLFSRRSSNVNPQDTRPNTRDVVPATGIRADRYPSRYAAGKLSTLRSRWEGDLGRYVRDYAPQVWPGVPATAFLGFTSIGSRDEDTAPTANQIFHEVGYFQTPAGPASGPAPNPNANASYNAWGKIASEGLAAELLGRPVNMRAGGWRGAAGVPDQVAVGLLDLHRELTSFRSGAPRAGVPVPLELASVYTVACAFSAFSAGAAGAVRNFAAVDAAGALRDSSNEAHAWDLICEHASALARAGRVPLTNRGTHRNPCYTLLRTTQKLAAGAKLAQALGLVEELAWYPRIARGQLASAEEGITAAAYGVRP